MDRRFLTFVAASAAFMIALLLLDGDGLARQCALGLATACFVAWFARGSGVDGRQIVCAILVATAGEIVLSLGWGLYSYRHALIPLYVPPGHGLFYLLAAATARQPAIRAYERAITRSVLVCGSIVAAFGLYAFTDVWGCIWWLAAFALIARSRNRLLLSSCVVYTMILEWVGTSIGNWQWAATVPLLGLHSANPPAGVGILYILLDLIVVAIARVPLFQPSPGYSSRAAS
ncbi:MAG TPA: hypothetical protein VF824_04715 [Thermoanaerobaculia bacterium]|jgi:hypothetical protein